MSLSYEPIPMEPPDIEMAIASHLRSVGTRPGTMYGRRFPSAMRGSDDKLLGLPCTVGGTTYDVAVVVRDDGGTWPRRSVSVTVLASRDGDWSQARSLAAWVAGRLAALAVADGLPVAAVTAVRGPLSVADVPPEFQVTADLVVVG